MNPAEPPPEPMDQEPPPSRPTEPPQLDEVPVVAAQLATDSAAESPTAALDAKVEGADGVPAKLPQPGLALAILLTLVPLVAQLVLGIGLTAIAAIVFVIVTARPHELARFATDFQVLLIPVGTLITLLVALAVSWQFFGRSMGRKLAWRRVSLGQLICVVALTVPLAVLASEVTNYVGAVLEHVHADWLDAVRESGGELFSQFVILPAWLVFLGGCLLPGLGEEIYCRGVLSRGLVARYGVVVGTLFAAGLFGAMHLEPVQAIGAFALGIGLQFVFLTTRSLAAPIILHTLNNSFAFLSMRYAESYPIPGVTPMPDGSVAHTPFALIVAAIVAAGALVAVMVQNRTRWQLPDGSEWNPGYATTEMPSPQVGAVAVCRPPHPLLILAAVIAFGLFSVALVMAHQSVPLAPQ